MSSPVCLRAEDEGSRATQVYISLKDQFFADQASFPALGDPHLEQQHYQNRDLAEYDALGSQEKNNGDVDDDKCPPGEGLELNASAPSSSTSLSVTIAPNTTTSLMTLLVI